MTSVQRARTLYDLSVEVLRTSREGSFVECGVWRGGSAAVMAKAIMHSGQQRPLHLFDSFEGLPEPGPEDGAKASEYCDGLGMGRLVSTHKCQAGIDVVEDLILGRIGFPKDLIHLHVGWFQDTMPKDALHMDSIALLRLDGDWYESTKVCLDHLYEKLIPGGVLLLDDYHMWEGCRKATDEFRSERGIKDRIVNIDSESVYWIKT